MTAAHTPTLVLSTPDDRCLIAHAGPCPGYCLRLDAPRFDWPCGCGRTSDACTRKEDGTCD